MKQKRKMPLGIRDFEEMRRGDYLYVDKTRILYGSWLTALSTIS